MGIKIKLLSFIIGLIFFLFVLKNVKKNSFSPSYGVLWIGICLFLVSIPLLEDFYRWIAISGIGIIDARHIIYIALIGFLLIYIFFLTIKISELSDRVQQMISTISILENAMKRNNESS